MRSLPAWPNLKVLTIDNKQSGNFLGNKAEKEACVPIISGRKIQADQMSLSFIFLLSLHLSGSNLQAIKSAVSQQADSSQSALS